MDLRPRNWERDTSLPGPPNFGSRSMRRDADAPRQSTARLARAGASLRCTSPTRTQPRRRLGRASRTLASTAAMLRGDQDSAQCACAARRGARSSNKSAMVWRRAAGSSTRIGATDASDACAAAALSRSAHSGVRTARRGAPLAPCGSRVLPSSLTAVSALHAALTHRKYIILTRAGHRI